VDALPYAVVKDGPAYREPRRLAFWLRIPPLLIVGLGLWIFVNENASELFSKCVLTVLYAVQALQATAYEGEGTESRGAFVWRVIRYVFWFSGALFYALFAMGLI